MAFIQQDLNSYVDICDQIKYHRAQIKELVERKTEVETRVKEFLKETEQVGIIHQGRKIILDTRQRKTSLRKRDEQERLRAILQNYGIRDPDVLIEEMRRKDVVSREYIKIQDP